MAKRLVIIRQLPGHDPVAHCIIKKPEDMTEEKYLQSEEIQMKANNLIEYFKATFVEFQAAKFYTYFVEEGEL